RRRLFRSQIAHVAENSFSRQSARALRHRRRRPRVSRPPALLAMELLDLSRQLMRRCDELGAISDETDRLTRTFASPAMRCANQLVGSWMRDAGMQVREDAAFNLLGRWNSAERGAKTFLLGSHLDTVRDAGKYDGPLGVLTAIATMRLLRERGTKLPFNV